MVTEDYVSFETAKLLKEKGFDESTNCQYPVGGIYIGEVGEYNITDRSRNPEKYIPAPTLQMAMKWLREVHNIDVVIDAAVGMLGVKVYVPLISTYKTLKDSPSKVCQIKKGIYYKDDKGVIPALQHFNTYEEACESAIRYILENLI